LATAPAVERRLLNNKEHHVQTTQLLPLSTIYAGWGRYQRSLVKMLAPLSVAQLALPVPAHDWTIGMVAQHMIADRVWWFQLWTGQGGPEVAPIVHWDPADPVEQPPLEPAALLAGLETTWQMVLSALEHWTPADLETIYQPPAALSEAERNAFGPRSLEWMIWHVVEHEIHHGGELSIALGLHGLPGIYGNA
jgi:uncharacterized damage-inducible protein DinB